MRNAWMIGAVSAVVALTGCMNFSGETAVEPEVERPRPSPAQRETARIERALSERTLNPLEVKRKFAEMTASMRSGALDFSRGEFFSGMTDEALLRQAMLTWDLSALFEKMRDGSHVKIDLGRLWYNQIVRQALTTLLAANSAKATVVGDCDPNHNSQIVFSGVRYDPVKEDYLLRVRPMEQALLHSWSLNRYNLPYLRRYAAASAWLELCDLANGEVVWSGVVDSSRNFVGDYGPLLWLYEALGTPDEGTTAFSPALVAVTAPARAWGYPFSPANEVLVGEAFRKIPLSDALFSGIAAGDKSIEVLVMEDDSFLKSKYAEAIRSLLLERGLKVCFPARQDNAAPARSAEYLFICRVDYAGVTALPDAPGSGTFRRRAAVLLWAELVEMPSCKVVWCGQLSGKSEVLTDPLIFYPLIFKNANFDAQPKSSKNVSSAIAGE